MTSQLVGADFTGGALLPNYVNGRLLVAEDLATEQSTLRARDNQIGEAAGAGVVRGLWVTSSATTMTIAPGLAVARSGAPVVVSQSVTLQLALQAAGTPADSSVFSCCGSAPSDGPGSALATGIYVLTVRPAGRLEGSAPMAPAPGSTLSPCCVAQWQIEGVEFRVIALPVGQAVAGVTMTETNRRNLVAHWCFGTQQLAALGADPFRFDPAYGGLDGLDPADLTPDDVPLATFRWDGGSVSDLDNWSARRRVTEPDPVPSSWSVTTSDRRTAAGQARFLQFQDQAEELVSRSLAGSAHAWDYFGILPPVGFLPVGGAELRAVATGWLKGVDQAADRTYYGQLVDALGTFVGYGFNPPTFFSGLARFGGVITWDIAEWALHQSWRVRPAGTWFPGPVLDAISVSSGTSGTNVNSGTGGISVTSVSSVTMPLTYYYVAENIEAAKAGPLAERASFSPREAPRDGLWFVRSSLYVVFIANQRWVSGALGPVVSDQLGTVPPVSGQ
jgi:hypothetical protein